MGWKVVAEAAISLITTQSGGDIFIGVSRTVLLITINYFRRLITVNYFLSA